MTGAFGERYWKLVSQATHADIYGNLYKFVNGSWWKLSRTRYCGNITYPHYSKVDHNKNNHLMKI